MKVCSNLPFEVGQQAEAKSFMEGYRGAWFRCKIIECGQRGAEPAVALDYLDYDDYKKSWIQLYRVSPAEKHSDYKKRHLMLRPSYPQIYHQSQMPDTCEISEMVGIVDGSWEVGDLVDWFKDGCYWSGWITEVIDVENVQVQFPKPPMGEGETEKVSCKDLRPTLDWTPKLGWIAPIFEEGKTFRRCVRLIHPMGPGEVRNNVVGSSETSSHVSSSSLAGSMPAELPLDSSGRENLNQASDIKMKNSSPEPPEPFSHTGGHIPKKHSCKLLKKQMTDTSNVKIDGCAEKNSLQDSSSSIAGDRIEPVLARNDMTSAETPKLSLHSRKRIFLEKHSFNLLNKQKTDTSKNIKDDGAGKNSLSDNVSSIDDDKFEPVLARQEVASKDWYKYCGSSKKMRISEAELSSTSSGTIESSIMDLEVLINKVKLLKGALTYGIEFSNSMKPSWKLLETRLPLPINETASDL
ncbi:hypothetical protein MKW94_016748 [Papaver nudicaule]|uniref:Agenet domain-containing protein n=1 Tax=Papaver nudicaule TaxID=74823 RepID=A0AA41VFI1_PAPNU|nr:hypothetical protein [Papaver nudicaule]